MGREALRFLGDAVRDSHRGAAAAKPGFPFVVHHAHVQRESRVLEEEGRKTDWRAGHEEIRDREPSLIAEDADGVAMLGPFTKKIQHHGIGGRAEPS